MLKINRIDTNLLRSLKPCEDRLENWLLHYAEWSGTVIEFLLLDKITYSDKRWVLFNRAVLDKSDFVELACRLAKNVLPVFQRVFPSDKRPRNAIIVARLVNATDPTFYASANAAAAAANAAAADANAAAAAAADANAAAAAAAANAAANAALNAAAYAAATYDDDVAATYDAAAYAAYVADVAYAAADAAAAAAYVAAAYAAATYDDDVAATYDAAAYAAYVADVAYAAADAAAADAHVDAAAAAYVADVASAAGAETEQLNIIISYLNEICNVVVNDTQQNNVVNLTQDILGRNVNE